MKLVVIDLEWLDKEIRMAYNDGSGSITGLNMVRAKVDPIEPHIDATWQAAQQATADREGYINFNMNPGIVHLTEFKELHGYK